MIVTIIGGTIALLILIPCIITSINDKDPTDFLTGLVISFFINVLLGGALISSNYTMKSDLETLSIEKYKLEQELEKKRNVRLFI